MMRRVWAIILAVALCLSFAACGKEKEVPNTGNSLTDSLRSKQTSGNFATDVAEKPIGKTSELGLYYGTTYAYNDQVYNMTDIYSSGVSLELQSGEKAVLFLDGEPLEGTWKLDGETFVMTYQLIESPGTLQGDTITIDFMGMGMKMTFVKDGGSGSVVPEAPVNDPEKPAEEPAEKPVEAPASSLGGTQSYVIDEFFSNTEVTIYLALPESMWVADAGTRTLYAYNEPSADVTHSASPRIQFELKDSLENVNTYMEKAGNLREIPGRTIGNVQMQGRIYDLWGMEWTEYYGELPNGLWMIVKVSGVSLDAGSEGSEILDSVVFE